MYNSMPDFSHNDFQLTPNQIQEIDHLVLYNNYTEDPSKMVQKLIDVLQKTWDLRNKLEDKPLEYSLDEELRIEQIKRAGHTIPDSTLIVAISTEMRRMFIFQNALNRSQKGAKLSENQANI
jgi:hypothetical protein